MLQVISEGISLSSDGLGLFKVRASQIRTVFDEDGQVIELKLVVKYKYINLHFLVVDGMHVNILSNKNEIADENILGSFEYLGLDLFNLNN